MQALILQAAYIDKVGRSQETLLQVFEGVHQVYDVFAHQNVEFWSTMMVAYNTTGFISCAGTNFAIRATALRACGMPHSQHLLNLQCGNDRKPFCSFYVGGKLMASSLIAPLLIGTRTSISQNCEEKIKD